MNGCVQIEGGVMNDLAGGREGKEGVEEGTLERVAALGLEFNLRVKNWNTEMSAGQQNCPP